MIYWLHRLADPFSRYVPRRLSYALATVIARVVFLLWTEKRENAMANLHRVLGAGATPTEVRRIAQRAFTNYAKYMVDMLILARARPGDLERRVTIHGWHHFQEALDRGTGLIFVGGHIGNSDLAAAILAGRGFPVHVIAEPLQPPRWDRLVQAARQAVGLRVVPLGSSAVRFLRVLRQKEILAFLIDRPMADQGVPVRFFGCTTKVPGGAAALALRANACILGAYIVRVGDSYVADISPAIALDRTGDTADDLEGLTQAIFDWLERVIRQYPDQWFMFRPMWPDKQAR